MVRLYWLEEQWNKPSLTDHYIMRLIWEVHYLLAKGSPSTIDLSKFKLNFGDQNQEKNIPGNTKEEKIAAATAASKGRWGSLFSSGGFKYRTNAKTNRERKKS